MGFKDHFSGVADTYANYRPDYPADLFAWLARQCPKRELAWDCGAGSGQAARPLAGHFDRVIATDASAAQLARAPRHERIEWRAAPAEESGLPPSSVDLAVVAQALHWFDLEKFYGEARRVLKPEGLVAVWCYGVMEVEGAEVDAIAFEFYHDVVGPYWPPERQHVESGYRDLPFPFAVVEAPEFSMEARWSLPSLLGYVRSWSATAAFVRARGLDPVEELRERLQTVWGQADRTRLVRWPLSLRAGRV